jgi:hypothetical protein
LSLSVLLLEAVFEVLVLEPLGLALLRGFEGGDESGSDGMRRGMSVALIVDDDLLRAAGCSRWVDGSRARLWRIVVRRQLR